MPNYSCWFVLQASSSKYDDREGEYYEYPPRIPNGRRVAVGDVLVIIRSKGEAEDQGRIAGIGVIGAIEDRSSDRRIALYNRYMQITPLLSFAAIGGDPRTNYQNSIASVHEGTLPRLLSAIGLSNLEEIPLVNDVKRNMDSDQTNQPSEWFIREELQKRVIADLLGPARGEDEELLETRPSRRYLVGTLAPKTRYLDAEDAIGDELSQTCGGSDEEEQEDRWEAPASRIIPSSMGCSFSVQPDMRDLQVEVSWGTYERVESETEITDSGKARTVWRRSQFRSIIPVDLTGGQRDKIYHPSEDIGQIELRVRCRPEDRNGRSVSVFLINSQTEPEHNRDSAWLFQVKIVVRDKEDRPVFVRRPKPPGLEDEEAEILSMMYRRHLEFAVGHGVSVDWTVDRDYYERAIEIRTVSIPIAEVPQTVTPTATDNPHMNDLVLDMKEIASMGPDQLHSALEPLVTAYDHWISDLEIKRRNSDFQNYVEVSATVISRARESALRIREGISTLASNEQARTAFQFANRAMWQQRIHSDLVASRVRNEQASIEDLDVPEHRSWRPFQLGFLLTLVPSLSSPTHPDRSTEPTAIADLLWFPTGGGKTEAYLGAAAYVIAMRRLQGNIGGFDGTHGVSVFTRYTLRLLTVQQFQRTTALVCAMELIRREAISSGENPWGTHPFRIGLWVGNQVTPGTTKNAEDAVMAARGARWMGAGRGTPLQIGRCPWCGSVIRPNDIDVRTGPRDIGLTITYCSDENGECPFCRRNSDGEGLPLLVVDEEIYHHPPDILIATVDKFAQMPWKSHITSLFGRVQTRCPRHGYIVEDERHGSSHNSVDLGRRRLPKVSVEPAVFLRPPDLIIQDELHLINGTLGTVAGLYETAVDELCSWEIEGKKVRPKLVASTATIRQAREQVHALFLRNVRVFPPTGMDVDDQFFAVRHPISVNIPGRRYLGICAPGYARPAVLIRVYTAFLAAAQALYVEYGDIADPWTTVIGYFNSLRELGGMRRLVEDDVRTRCFRIGRGFEPRPGLLQRDVSVVDELTSRRSSVEIPRILSRLEQPFSISQKIENAHTTARYYGEDNPRALDVVLSTNMVSVGVDVRRLGLMIVNGQPKTTAEYIQATSRIGRNHPGLVCTVLNWARPRDASHFETFRHYHETYYQHVESLSVTPFSRRAVERSVLGVLVTMMRLGNPDLSPEDAATLLTDQADPRIESVLEKLRSRAQLVLQSQNEGARTADIVQSRFDTWTAEAAVPQRTLTYTIRKDVRVPLIYEPVGIAWDSRSVARSMRNVEPMLPLMLWSQIQHERTEWSRREETNDLEDSEAEVPNGE